MTPYYSDDLVTLYHGDCLEVTEWLSADVLVTDPPYGMRMGQGATARRRGRMERGTCRAVVGDHDAACRDDALRIWGDRPAIIFGTWRVARPQRVRHRLIWHKAGMSSGAMRAPFLTNDEEIYICGEGFKASAPPVMSVITTRESRPRAALEGHPTTKPIPLMSLLIDRAPAGSVADPFAGSGSTLVAAKTLGRSAIGVEIEERNCEIAAKLLAQDAFSFEESA
jgi:DNA modification methylase